MYKLEYCSELDFKFILEIMSNTFPDYADTMEEYLKSSKINWNKSVKAILNDKIIGILIVCNYNISDESDEIEKLNPELLKKLNKFNYISGLSFVILPQYRGGSLYQEMINKAQNNILNYDFVFIPVAHKLKTHNFWKRFGANYFFEDSESKYYLIPIRKTLEEIFA